MLARTFVSIVATLALVSCARSDDADPVADTSPTSDTVADTTDTAVTSASDADADADADTADLYPDVIDATATFDGTSWTISATLSSPYDSPERYADAWRVVGPDGTVYGERILTHDHAAEQPFTRSQSGIEIPDDVDEVTIEGRDQVSGYGGATVTIALGR